MILKRLRRGEVWWVDLDPIVGHEQAKLRPCLIVSVDEVNLSKLGLVVAIPLTTKDKNFVWQVSIDWEQASPNVHSVTSFALVHQLRALSLLRICRDRAIGVVSASTMQEVETLLVRLFMPLQ